MNQEIKLEDIWQAELDILDEIDRVCTDNGLRYSLAYGTLLGAVRHGGFIPWDDDIDIMMPREDYDRLRAIWKEKAKREFLLEDETMFSDYVNNFAKIRKDHTTFLQFEVERTRTYHKGFFVDIFPGDRVAPEGLSRKVQYVAFAMNLLYNRGYSSGVGGVRGFLEKCLLKAVPKGCHSKVSSAFGRFSRRWNGVDDAQLVFASTASCCKKYYPADLFENLQRIPFQEKTYLAVQNADAVLRVEYGDYMKLPPESERVWTHHPIIVDFIHNYEELEREK